MIVGGTKVGGGSNVNVGRAVALGAAVFAGVGVVMPSFEKINRSVSPGSPNVPRSLWL